MDEKFMKEALKEAKKSYEKLEVPVGAIIVKDGKIIGRGHNLKEEKQDPICHAEVIAIRKACKKINNWRLNDCTLYVTLEPCAMCTGVINEARLSRVVIGAKDETRGACGSNLDILDKNIECQKGIIENECKNILQDFFKSLRKTKQ